MRLNELLTRLEGFEETETDRIRPNVPYIMSPEKGVIEPRWIKLVCKERNSTMYIRGYEEPNPTTYTMQILLPENFEDMYWETIKKMEEVSGITFKEYLRDHLEDGDNYKHNRVYFQEIRKVYRTLLDRVRFIVKKSLEAEETEESGLDEAKINYLDLTYHHERTKIKPGNNVRLRLVLPFPQNDPDERMVPEVINAVDIFDNMTETRKEDWEKVEKATLAYTQHLRDLYQPIV